MKTFDVTVKGSINIQTCLTVRVNAKSQEAAQALVLQAAEADGDIRDFLAAALFDTEFGAEDVEVEVSCAREVNDAEAAIERTDMDLRREPDRSRSSGDEPKLDEAV